MDEEIVHLDAIGRPLKVGDPVAIPEGITSMLIGRITAIGKKQIRVVRYGEPERQARRYGTDRSLRPAGKLRYPEHAILIDGPEITMYLLKFANRTRGS